MRNNLLRIVLLSLLLVGLGLGFWFRDYFAVERLGRLVEWIQSLGGWGVALYLLLYSIGPVFGTPAIGLTLLGGMLFGPLWGAVLAILGATIADSLGFIVARYTGQQFLEKRIGGVLEKIKKGVEAEGWRFVAFLRLTPIFPFFVVSYGMGLTRINFWVYAITTFFCIIPGASVYAYIGYAGREALLSGEVRLFFIGIGLIAALAFLPLLIKRLRGADT